MSAMSQRSKVVAGAVLAAIAGALSLAAQTNKNPIDTRPENKAAPSCSYTGSVSGGKASNSSACTPAATPGTDPNQIAPPNTTQRFPFPGSSPATLPPAAAGQAGGQPAAAAGQSGKAAPNGNNRFPFPGESAPEDAAAPQNPAAAPQAPNAVPGQKDSPSPLQNAGSSGSSSKSNSPSSSSAAEQGYSSSNAGSDLPDDDPNAPMPTPRHHTDRKKLPKVVVEKSNEEKAAQDVQVAGFYANDGNFSAAYLRAKEAVSFADDDPEAHLILAESARKLGKLDEALANYKKVIALDPVPKVRKVAEKALKEMSGS